MKILMLNTYDIRGGAARASWRLFNGLINHHADVTLLVQEKKSQHERVKVLNQPPIQQLNFLRPYIDFAIPVLQTRQRVLFSSSLLPDNLLAEILSINPDVVHLNWIAGGFIRIESLGKITKPVVWTLQDMWGFTGGCHYTGECERFTESCGKCPMLHSENPDDLSHKVFLRKKKAIPGIRNLVLTAPSRWMADQIRKSALFGSREVVVIPNGLDTAYFKPRDKMAARRQLPVSQTSKLIAFGAIRATETPSKGFSLLAEALKRVNRNDIQLVVFGSSGPGNTDISGLDVKFLGNINDDSTVINLNSAADIVAVPSVQEVFGQTATEAMACGSPVLAFDATGLRDIVVHEQTGYLAEPFKVESLAQGIKFLLENDERRTSMGFAARNRAEQVFNIPVVASSFLDVYRKICRNENQ